MCGLPDESQGEAARFSRFGPLLQNEYASATNRNMPYIVTTKRKVPGVSAWSELASTLVTRRAVATLEEAHQEARRHIHGIDLMARLEVSLLFGSGGTVGPPDGTVIEAAPTTWIRLATEAAEELHPASVEMAAQMAAKGNRLAQKQILDAYNASQS
jgi:hypothetical protein